MEERIVKNGNFGLKSLIEDALEQMYCFQIAFTFRRDGFGTNAFLTDELDRWLKTVAPRKIPIIKIPDSVPYIFNRVRLTSEGERGIAVVDIEAIEDLGQLKPLVRELTILGREHFVAVVWAIFNPKNIPRPVKYNLNFIVTTCPICHLIQVKRVIRFTTFKK